MKGPPDLRDEKQYSDTNGPTSLSSRVVQCTWRPLNPGRCLFSVTTPGET
jgi:hypothetical protein